MSVRKRNKVEYRYFEMPPHSYAIGILGGSGAALKGEGGPERREARLHLHNYMEVGCCDGGGELKVGGESYRLQKRTICIIPPYCPHAFLAPAVNSRWGFAMVDAAGFLNDVLGSGRPAVRELKGLVFGRPWILDRQEHEKLGFITSRLFYELQNREEYYEESVKGLLLAFVMEVAGLNGSGGASDGRREKDRELIAPALDFIHENCRRNIKLSQLAGLCCISETHFRRVFAEVMNTPPARYVNLVRIFSACEFLRKSDYTIREIGSMTGFPTLSTFQRNFKSQTGVSPRDWRFHPEKLGLHASEKMDRIAQFISEYEHIEST